MVLVRRWACVPAGTNASCFTPARPATSALPLRLQNGGVPPAAPPVLAALRKVRLRRLAPVLVRRWACAPAGTNAPCFTSGRQATSALPLRLHGGGVRPAAPPVLAALGKVRLRSPTSSLGMARSGCIPSLHPCVHALMRSCSSVPARVLRYSCVRPPPVGASCVICFTALGVVLCVAPFGSWPSACLRSFPVPCIPLATAHASLPAHARLALPAACSREFAVHAMKAEPRGYLEPDLYVREMKPRISCLLTAEATHLHLALACPHNFARSRHERLARGLLV